MDIMKVIVRKYKEKGVRGGFPDVARVVKRRVNKRIERIITRVRTPYHYRRLKIWKPVYGLNQTEMRERKVIVSLTSYPARFPALHVCIKSLLSQTYKPDKVILYLGDDAPPETVTENITQLIPYGLEIAHRSDNLKPHKKYFYAMQEYPDDIIITVDDDIMYDKNLVKQLMKSYGKYPGAVHARRVRKMMKDKNGVLVSCSKFPYRHRKEKLPSMQLFANNGAGVLHPPGCLPSEAFDVKLIKKLCLNADDIWLKFMQIKNNVPIVGVRSRWMNKGLLLLPNTQDTALSLTNNAKGQSAENDMFVSRLEEYFSIYLTDYC